jgi:cytochrome P450
MVPLNDLTIRSILHDPDLYSEPFAFNPERFLSQDGSLDPNVKDPRDIVFGFGRRSVTS